jgi:opacity protein-like surface antigen
MSPSKLLIVACLLIVSFCSAQEPATKAPQTKFFRPALTNVVLNSIPDAEPLVREMKKIKPQPRFDDHSLEYGDLSVNFPKIEDIIKEITTLNPFKALKEADAKHQAACAEILINTLKPAANKAVAKWWCRDAKGNMSDSLVNFRGMNTATDADVIKDNASENARRAELGYELLNKSYFAVYEISSLKTMNQVYDEQDAAARKLAEKTKKPFTPVERKLEGWQIEYNLHILKIDWTDSLQTTFFDNYWVDASTTENRSSKVSSFDKNVFPMNFVTKVSGILMSTQSNNPDDYGPLRKRLSMEELLLQTAPDFQEDGIFKASKLINDFRSKAPLFTIYPTTAKLGTKEGIYIDQRFYAYELQLDKKGNKVAKRKGVVRPTKIMNNDGLASGDSPASNFKQQGGKELYSGMFIEMKEDYGVNASFLIKSTGGAGVGLELNLPRIWKMALHKSAPSILSGVHLGVYVAMGSETFKDITNFSFQDSAGVQYNVPEALKAEVSASVMDLGGYFGKEIYPLKKGNFYLYPQVGIAATMLSYTKVKINETGQEFELVSESSSDSETAEESINDFFKAGINAGLGIGMHFGPRLSVIATPTMVLGSWDREFPTGVEVSPFAVYSGLRFKF